MGLNQNEKANMYHAPKFYVDKRTKTTSNSYEFEKEYTFWWMAKKNANVPKCKQHRRIENV